MMAQYQTDKENKALRNAIDTMRRLIESNRYKSIEMMGQSIPEPTKTHLKTISNLLVGIEATKQKQIDNLRTSNQNAGATNSFFRQSIQRILQQEQLEEEQLDEEHRLVIKENKQLIIKLSNKFRDIRNQQAYKLTTITSSLKQKQEIIQRLSQQLKVKQDIFRSIKVEWEQKQKCLKEELQNMSLGSISKRQEQSKAQEIILRNLEESTEIREELEKKDLLIEALKKHISEKEVQFNALKQKSANLSNQSRVYSSINSSSHPSDAIISFPEVLHDAIEAAMQKKIVKNELLYNFIMHKRVNFHDLIDRKENTLLICLTTEGTIIGGFSTAGFSLNDEPQGTVAFLFSIENGQISVRNLKNGKSSINYDCDFLVFGNDEVSIQKGKNFLTSYIPVAASNELHYTSVDNDFFTQINEKNQIELRNYQVFALLFD